MVENRKLLPVAVGNLVQKQIAILHIRLGGKIIRNNCRFRNGNHVIKAKQTETTAVKLQYVFSGFQFGMTWLWGLHRDEITEATNSQDNTDVRTPLPLVEWDAEVARMKERNVGFADMTNE